MVIPGPIWGSRPGIWVGAWGGGAGTLCVRLSRVSAMWCGFFCENMEKSLQMTSVCDKHEFDVIETLCKYWDFLHKFLVKVGVTLMYSGTSPYGHLTDHTEVH